MRINQSEVRRILDDLKRAGFTSHDIATALELHQVKSNPRAVRRWYSGKTQIRNVEFRAIRDLLKQTGS